MNTASDARFWDRTSRKYARGAVADPAGYERTLDRTRALLAPAGRVLELGCGTERRRSGWRATCKPILRWIFPPA